MIRLRELQERDLPPGGVPGGTRHYPARPALVLRLEDDHGCFGLGEAAPLPGYMPDDAVAARRALETLFEGGGIALGRDGLATELRRLSAPLASASARFALEAALIDLLARRESESPEVVLRRALGDLEGKARPAFPPGQAPPLAALLPSELRSALELARDGLTRGIRNFKLKLGEPGRSDEELRTLAALRRELGDVGLRADANQTLREDELALRLSTLQALELEWLEEPCRDLPSTPLGVPLALDESLQPNDPDLLAARAAGVVALVLKPTALGGVARALELAARAAEAGIAAVVSHVYEGPIGVATLRALAVALGPGRPADGLDRTFAATSEGKP